MQGRKKLWWIAGLILLTLVGITACASGKTGGREYEPTILDNSSGTDTEPVVCVLKAVDEENQCFTIYNISSDADMTLDYSGITEVYDRYDKATVIGTLDIGEIIDVYTEPATSQVSKICVNKEAWEEQKVENPVIDQTEKIMKIYNSRYKYDSLVIADGQELVELIDLNAQDLLTIKGIDKQVYSINISLGHGYVRPSGYKDFVGGMVEIGYNLLLPVTKNMLIPVREGTYTARMTNGDLMGEKTIKVIRGQEIVMDMSEFKAEKVSEGYVTFKITPAGADLYINGNAVDYSEPIKLKYGKHRIAVALTGYNDYNGTLDLQDEQAVINISLVDRVAEVDEETEEDDSANPTPTPSPLPGTSSQEGSADSNTAQQGSSAAGVASDAGDTSVTEDEKASSTSTTKTVDSDHTMTITAPEGVEVYVDGTYKGISPCTFTKELGKLTISLSASGYRTRSYTVEVTDDDEDVSFSFANLVED